MISDESEFWNRLITKISKSSDKEIELNKIKSSINGCVYG